MLADTAGVDSVTQVGFLHVGSDPGSGGIVGAFKAEIDKAGSDVRGALIVLPEAVDVPWPYLRHGSTGFDLGWAAECRARLQAICDKHGLAVVAGLRTPGRLPEDKPFNSAVLFRPEMSDETLWHKVKTDSSNGYQLAPTHQGLGKRKIGKTEIACLVCRDFDQPALTDRVSNSLKTEGPAIPVLAVPAAWEDFVYRDNANFVNSAPLPALKWRSGHVTIIANGSLGAGCSVIVGPSGKLLRYADARAIQLARIPVSAVAQAS
jgi:hypothetical protein